MSLIVVRCPKPILKTNIYFLFVFPDNINFIAQPRLVRKKTELNDSEWDPHRSALARKKSTRNSFVNSVRFSVVVVSARNDIKKFFSLELENVICLAFWSLKKGSNVVPAFHDQLLTVALRLILSVEI